MGRRQHDMERFGGPRRVRGAGDDAAERIAAMAARSGVPVDEMLREVADFRLALETDMLIAAAALDSDAPHIASEVVDGEIGELADFRDRLLDRLADASISAAAPSHRRRPSRATRLMASAAALVGVMTLGLVARHAADEAPPMNTVSQEQAREDLGRLTEQTLRPHSEPAKVAAAAAQLHETIEALMEQHPNDVGVAQQIVTLLHSEVELLNEKPELRQLLTQVTQLAKRLERAVPAVKASVKPLLEAAATTRSASPAPSRSPSRPPSPKASPKPSASPSPTSSPSSSPNSSRSGSPGNLPTAPGS